MPYANHWLKWIGVLMLLALVGCNTSFNTAPIATPTIMPQPTSLPATPLPTISPTRTIMPTLSPAEAEAKVLDLLRDNGGCRLPCFWDFIPGQTRGSGIGSFLASLEGNVEGKTGVFIRRNDLLLQIDVVVNESSSSQVNHVSWLEIYFKAYQERGSSVNEVYGTSYYSEYFKYYTLPYLLTNYGLPEQVYVILDTGIAGMGLGIDLYLLSIEYPTKGWMAVFKMPLQIRGDMFLGCPSESFVYLRAWLPGDDLPDAFYGGFGGPDKSYLFTIEEATGMTVEEFYNRFKDPTNMACLETPVDIHKP